LGSRGPFSAPILPVISDRPEFIEKKAPLRSVSENIPQFIEGSCFLDNLGIGPALTPRPNWGRVSRGGADSDLILGPFLWG
jgi:hypothetical protein